METRMMSVVIQTMLVVLAGIYAMRASSVIFDGVMSPLTPVAALACAFSIALFYRAPAVPGLWLYAAIAMCVIGLAANVILLVFPDTGHADPTNLAFSAASVVCWGGLSIFYTRLAFVGLGGN